ncbi:MAG: adenylate/guanylate cyclase domain-containing protein [Spirulinaceae cyanobacterium]
MNRPVIICVDDEPIILESLARELYQVLGDDYLIETVETGEEALELVEEFLAEKYHIPLVLSDYIMPNIKGDELLKRIHEIAPQTLKILLTGQASVEAIGNGIKYANLYRYLAKPWQQEDLSLTVTQAIHSYFQTQKLAEQTLELQRLNQQQAKLITQLNENRNRLIQFLEAIPVGVGVMDAEGKPYYVNQKAQELLGKGISPEVNYQNLAQTYQVYKAGTNQIYPAEEFPIVKALQGEASMADDLEIHLDNKVIPIETWATPIYDQQGNVIYGINVMQDISDRQKAELERAKFTHELFELNLANERFVPRQFLQLLNKQSIVDVELGESVQQEMSVLFADIRNFTTLSEKMTPQDNFKFINSYFLCMEPAIINNNGFIDKYIGDAIMALFGGSADEAMQAGLAMLNLLAEFNDNNPHLDNLPVQIGVGINTGSLMLGVVGGQFRMDSTVISDAVNLASRIEKLTREYQASFLISHHTFSRLENPEDYALRRIAKVRVKGKLEEVTVYEVCAADLPEVREKKLATKELFSQALGFYECQSFLAAKRLFQECLKQNSQDKVAQVYLKSCWGQSNFLGEVLGCDR